MACALAATDCPSSQGRSGAGPRGWAPKITKLLGGSRKRPKQSSSDYVCSLLAVSHTGLHWSTLLMGGNALNPVDEAPSSQDAPPAPATEHISAWWSWVCGAAAGVQVPGAQCARSRPTVCLLRGSAQALNQVATRNLGPDTQQMLPLICGWWIPFVTFKLLARWLLQCHLPSLHIRTSSLLRSPWYEKVLLLRNICLHHHHTFQYHICLGRNGRTLDSLGN